MKGIIYKATNEWNGKAYIGQTIQSLKVRKTQHLKDAPSDEANRFHSALYQYPNSFTWEVLKEYKGSKKYVSHCLNIAEEFFILEYRTDDPLYGYNASTGGYSREIMNDRLKALMKNQRGTALPMLQYDRDGNFIREWESLREITRSLSKGTNWKLNASDLLKGLHYGYQWRKKESDDFPRKIKPYERCYKKGNSGRNEIWKTPTVVYDTKGNLVGEFEYKKDAFDRFGCSQTALKKFSTTYRLFRQSNKDYIFFKKEDGMTYPSHIEVIPYKKKVKEKRPRVPSNRISIACYDVSGNYLKSYSSISEAMEVAKCSGSTISKYCKSSLPIVIPPHAANLKYLWRYDNGNAPKKIEVVDLRPKKVFVKKKKEHRVIQYGLDGKLIKIWESIYKASCSGCDSNGAIYKSLKGNDIPSANYQWRRYEPDYKSSIDPIMERNYQKRVLQCTLDGKLIKTWDNAYQAILAKEEASANKIYNSLKGYFTKGQKYIWSYARNEKK